MSKIYNIYAKDKCLFQRVPEEEFQLTWGTLQKMVDFIKTDYQSGDLFYEEVEV